MTRRLTIGKFKIGLGVMLSFVALLFATAPALAAGAPSLGSAANFAVLGSSTVTCTNAAAVTGNVGLSTPGVSITGFNPDCTLTGTLHIGDAPANNAHNAAVTAYNALAGLPCGTNLTGQDLGGMTLAAGVYCFPNTSAGLTGTLNLTGTGPWIFQIGSTITTATDSAVLINGVAATCATASNAFWQVGSSATIGTRTAFAGNILALASISLVSGSSLSGRALALNGAVTMDANKVSACGNGAGNGGGNGDKDKDKDKDKGHDKDKDHDKDKGHDKDKDKDKGGDDHHGERGCDGHGE